MAAESNDANKSFDKKLLNIGLMILAFVGYYFVYPYIRDNVTTDGLYDQARELRQKGDCAGAIEKLNVILNREPRLEKARVSRGICYHREGRYDEALADYNEAIRVAPTSAPAVFDRGLLWLAKGNDDAALADFGKAIALDPKDADARVQHGQILRAYGRFDEAIADYEAAAALKPADARYPLRRIDTLRDKGNFAAALAAADKLAAGKPDEPSYVFVRIAVRRDQGDIEGALREADAAIAKWPNLPTGYLERGTLALFYTDKPAAAIEDLSKAVNTGFDYRLQMQLLDAGSKSLGVDTNDDYSDRIAPQTPFIPDMLYWVLCLHVAHVHAGDDDAAELKKNADDIAFALRRGLLPDERFAQWPGAVLRMLLGRLTPDELRAEAQQTNSQAMRRQRVCDVDFYLAEQALQHGERAAAHDLLQVAAEKCPPGAPERGFARAELARLGP